MRRGAPQSRAEIAGTGQKVRGGRSDAADSQREAAGPLTVPTAPLFRAVLPRRGGRPLRGAGWAIVASIGASIVASIVASIGAGPSFAGQPPAPPRGTAAAGEPREGEADPPTPEEATPGKTGTEPPDPGGPGEAGQPPPGEEGEGSGEAEAAPGEGPPVEAPGEESGERAATGEAGEEPAAEAGTEGEGGEEAEEGAEEEDLGPRVAGLAGAPAGILPGEEMASPIPEPGSPVVGLVLEEEGFITLTAGGRVVAYGPDGGRPRWGVMEGQTAALGRWPEGIALLDRSGGVEIRAPGDGAPGARFVTDTVPDPLRPPIPEAGPDPGRTAGGGPVRAAAAVGGFGPQGVFFAAGGRVHGFSGPLGERLFETDPAALPNGTDTGAAAGSVRAIALAGDPGEPRRFAAVSLGPGGLALLDAASGAVRWRRDDLGDIAAAALVLEEESLVIAGSTEGDLSVLRLEDGSTRWRRRLFEGFLHPPLASRGRLYAATDANSLYGYDLARGGERWRAALPGRPAASPLRVAGALFVAIRDGLLVEVTPATGLLLGRARDLGAEIFGVVRQRPDGPGETGWRQRRVYLGLRDGRLLVLRPRVSLGSGPS